MGSSTGQGELWGGAARDWAELQEPQHLPVWEAMLGAAKVGQGTRFFDAGCGGGGTSVLAAQRGAHVSGLDASEALIAIARKRVPKVIFAWATWKHCLMARRHLTQSLLPYQSNTPPTQL